MSNMLNPEELCQMIRAHIPDAEVNTGLFSGDDHFEMEVIAASFTGLSRIKQHQMVYAALGDHMKETIHALKLKTSIPKESS
ncbi:MAG: BolA family protein [Mariprofundaceae bacterium]